jgi:DNA-binding XRE family transcriptional regulator
MERGKRGISKQIAKKLAVLFGVSIEKIYLDKKILFL